MTHQEKQAIEDAIVEGFKELVRQLAHVDKELGTKLANVDHRIRGAVTSRLRSIRTT